jgi:hypothetical protein
VNLDCELDLEDKKNFWSADFCAMAALEKTQAATASEKPKINKLGLLPVFLGIGMSIPLSLGVAQNNSLMHSV